MRSPRDPPHELGAIIVRPHAQCPLPSCQGTAAKVLLHLPWYLLTQQILDLLKFTPNKLTSQTLIGRASGVTSCCRGDASPSSPSLHSSNNSKYGNKTPAATASFSRGGHAGLSFPLAARPIGRK